MTDRSRRAYSYGLSGRTTMSRLHVVLLLFLIASIAQSQTLPAPDAVTDPKQLTSKPNAQVEKNLTIEKLYMTRAIGGSTWSPVGKKIAFVSNMSGRNNLWLVG